MCLGAIALSGCQSQTDDSAATAADASSAETTASEDYPLLQTVPPRPQLSYTIEQQRDIVEALIADRENARYTDQVVRYRAGLSSLPPPPAPPASVAPAAGPVADSAAAAATPQSGEAAGVARPEASEQGATEPDVFEADTFAGFLHAMSRRFQSDAPEDATPEEAMPEPGAPDDVSDASTASQDGAAQTSATSPDPAMQAIEAPPDASPPLPPAQAAVAARRVAGLPADPLQMPPIPAPHPERAALAGPGLENMPQPAPSKPPPPADGDSAAAHVPHGVAVTRAVSIAHQEGS